MLYILLLLTFVLAIGSQALSKSNSNSLAASGGFGLAVNSLLTGLCASLIFYVFSGFSIHLNRLTVLYAVAFSFVCTMAVALGMVILRYLHVAVTTVFTASAGLIFSLIIGKFIFGEVITSRSLIRVALMLVVIAVNSVPMFLRRKAGGEGRKSRRDTLVSVVLLLAVVLTAASATILSRSYARNPGVCDKNSYFFITNVFIVIHSLIWGTTMLLRNKEACLESLGKIQRRAYWFIPLNTLNSNIGSLVNITLLSIADVSFISPVTSAMGIVASGLVSVAFRERLTTFNIIALVLATACVLIPS